MIVNGDDLTFEDNVTEGATASSATAGLRINGNRARVVSHSNRHSAAGIFGVEINGNDAIVERVTHGGDRQMALHILPSSMRTKIGAIGQASRLLKKSVAARDWA